MHSAAMQVSAVTIFPVTATCLRLAIIKSPSVVVMGRKMQPHKNRLVG
jgi:hypothetical protein